MAGSSFRGKSGGKPRAASAGGLGRSESEWRPGSPRVVRPGTILDVVEELDAGLPLERLTSFLKESGLPREALLEALQIPARTLARRRRSGRLSAEESGRLHRLATVFEQAVGLLEDRQRASAWMTRPARAFAGITPLAMARTEAGAREVENLIGRLEHGVFT